MYKLLKKLKRAIRRKFRGDRTQRINGEARRHSRFWIGLLTLFAILFSSLLFPVSHHFTTLSTPSVGDFATEDIVAPFDFPVYKSVAELEEEKAELAKKLPAVLIYDQRVADSLFHLLDRLFFLAESLRTRIASPNLAADKLRLSFPGLSKPVLTHLVAIDSLARVKTILGSALKDRYIVGIAPEADVIPPNFTMVSILKTSGEFPFAADQVLTKDLAAVLIQEELRAERSLSRADQEYLSHIARYLLSPNLEFSPLETERRKDAAFTSIQREKIIFKAGQRLVAKNQQVTKAQLEWLQALAEYRSQAGSEAGLLRYLLPILSRILFVSFIYLSFVAAFFFLQGKDQFRLSQLFPLYLIILATLLLVFLTSEEWNLSTYLYPLAIGLIIVIVLYDFKVAVLITFTVALLLGLLFHFDFEVAFLTIISGTVATFSLREVQKRSDFYRCALYLVLALTTTAFILESLRFSSAEQIARQCGFAAANAIISTFLAMALLPLFESLFDFTTNVTLLELSDMNHPLLRRLAMEAPGTYQHSMVLGNLAEAAAKAVGANSLLARVGAYYHDIGKMDISEYFIENQFGIKSKHDELTPHMSAIVITSHIKKGRELAQEYDLPDRIIEFIEEHHGTSVMTYFFDKAKNQPDNGAVSETGFRYPGPKPQSKETAILMISDSVEAASRTLEDPKPSRIRALVKRLINDKVQSGQLSNSKLTLADLQRIEDAFVQVLIGVFHGRVDYPKKEEESSV